MAKTLKVLTLLEPDLCSTCRFQQIGIVELKDGTKERMTHCLRGDCDNWDTSTVVSANGIEIEDSGG